MKRVLHITNWYPNRWNDVEAVFVREQFRLFARVSDAELLHIQVREGSGLFRYERICYSENETGYYILTRIKTYRILEYLTTILLLYAMVKHRAMRAELLHFHIAYPLLVHYHYWKKLFHVPVIISEHWSAYHFNFYMPENTTKLERIKRIFRQNLPLITVSKSLLDDIRSFSATSNFPSYIIPNVIDLDIYRPSGEDRCREVFPCFFTVNHWRKIKNPFPMLEAFAHMAKEGKKFRLKIGGYGELLDKIIQFVEEHSIRNYVVFLGKMEKEEIAREMRYADCYLFSSEYETFCAVCAQALCCGTPIMGPNLEAVKEYAPKFAFMTLQKNDVDNWRKFLTRFITSKPNLIYRQEIAAYAHERFSYDTILKAYQKVLNAHAKS